MKKIKKQSKQLKKMRQKWNINLKMSQSKCSTGGVRGLINHSMACGAFCDACKMSNPRKIFIMQI